MSKLTLVGEVVGLVGAEEIVGEALGEAVGDLVLQSGFSLKGSMIAVTPVVSPKVRLVIRSSFTSNSIIVAPDSLAKQLPFAASSPGYPPQYMLLMITSFT